jgi:hypothetical protein
MAEVFWDLNSPAVQFYGSVGESSAWDTATLGGSPLPGLVRVEAEPGRKLDVRTTPASDGATIVDQGFEPANPKIKITIWTQAQWSQLQLIITKLYPRPGKSRGTPPPAIPLVHPGANALGVNAVLIKSISTLVPSSIVGAYEMQFNCVQYVKPKPAVVGVPRLTIGTVAETETVPRPSAPSAPSSTNSGP